MEDKIKKNLLDLQYSKYLQYYNTSIIILFTYIIGIFIIYITKQVDYKALNQTLLINTISVAVIFIIVLLIIDFRNHQKNIMEEIKKLKM
ncbi:hypothetical protein J4462_02320 [Candidatus Pacearchaeota archaeon]|nr:hypothetical protein [Candidatus Pacearchaeota archaeon]